VDQDNSKRKPATKKRNKKKASEKSQYIDGQKLSKSEVEFEEFLNERFDSNQWLRKNGLIF
jgi:hypothetical protein